jgi:hypothetical protein
MARRSNRFRRLIDPFALMAALLPPRCAGEEKSLMDQSLRALVLACLALSDVAFGPLEAQALPIHRDSSAAAIGGAPTLRRRSGVIGSSHLAEGLSGGGRRLPKPGVFGPHGRGGAPKGR